VLLVFKGNIHPLGGWWDENENNACKKWPALSALATLFWFCSPAGAQTMAAQKNDDSSRAVQDRDRDLDRQELARFDQFLDSHREIAEQVRKDPSLLNNKEFVKNHPALQSYLQEHPGVRDQVKQDPSAFMRQEDRYDRREDMRRGDRNATRQEMGRFDQFLDHHREMSEQLRKNPSLVNDQQYLQDHPALQTYLQDHPAVRQQITQNPNAFMQAEERYCGWHRHPD
jgi:dsDNA-binding SOS-regulon protein